MDRSKKNTVNKVLLLVAVVSLVTYVGYQAYRSIFSGIKTELASQHSVYESIEASGIILRSETLIPSAGSGHVYYTVQNGARLAKDGELASVYSSEADGQRADRVKEIDARLKILHNLQQNASSQRLSLDIVDAQLLETLNSFIADGENGVFESTTDAKSDFLSLLSKRQIIAGKPVDFSAEINKLEKERSEIMAQYQSPLSVVKAPVAGYFVDKADGYESMLSSVDPMNLTPSMLTSLLQTPPQTPPSCVGKIVGGYEWYFACKVPESYYATLAVGTDLSIRMDFVSDEEIPVTVVACTKDGSGEMAVVLRCAYMSEELSDIRMETAQLLLVRHSGLKVPKRAIVINDEMEAGVYIRSGNVAAFRKIKQIYSEPADYVICEVTEESGYLHLYDDIIVSGKGLYDGKSIR